MSRSDYMIKQTFLQWLDYLKRVKKYVSMIINLIIL